MYEGGNNKFIVEKPAEHHLNQLSKVNIPRNKNTDIMCLLMSCNEKATISLTQ